MSKWETAPDKLTEANLTNYMDLDENGIVKGAKVENHGTNMAEIQQELDNPKLNATARKVLMAEKQRLLTVSDNRKWETAPDSPSAVGSSANSSDARVWETAPEAPKAESFKPNSMDKTERTIAGFGEAGLNFVSGIPGALGSGFNYLGTLAATGGDTEAAMAVKRGTEKRINDTIQYQPRTEEGKHSTEALGKGFEHVIQGGGEAFHNVLGAVPLVGPDLEKNTDPEALKAIGKAYTEMMLNVAPVPLLGKGKGKAAKGVEAAVSKIEKIEPTTPVPPLESTIAHADDFGVVNPYDVGGHVTEAQKGRPSKINDPQGDLFGGRDLEAPIIPETLPKKEAVVREEYVPNPENPAMAEAFKKAETDAAFKELEATAERTKDVHYEQLEQQAIAQRAGELDYLHSKDTLKDKSLMAQDETIMMRGYLRRGDVRSGLGMIADTHPSRLYRELAKYLAGKVDGLSIKLDDNPVMKFGDREVTGLYDPNTHSIRLSGLGATSPHTILHEVVHALTSQMLQARPNDIRVKALNKLFDEVNKRGVAKEFPGIVNVREFVAEANSNPKFQEYLKGQRYENRTLFQRFVDTVKRMVGMDNPQMGNALEHAIDLSKQLMDASDAPTRKSMMEQFKAGGLPTKLADAMAQTPHDLPTPEVTKHGEVRDVVKKIPGLESPISDFAFYDKPIEEIVQMAVKSPDIPNNMMEKFAQQMQGGALFESLKTRNPVVKYTYERITRAFQEADHKVKTYLTGSTGLKSYMRDLTPEAKGEIHAMMMVNEGHVELTPMALAERGFSEKQIAYYMKDRELRDQFFKEINERRVEQGLVPMDKRVGHVAGRFMGDFSRMVFAMKDGKQQAVGRISGSTKWELERVTKFMEEQHPDWEFDKQHYNAIGQGRGAKDRFTGMMEAINFITKTDSNAKALLDSFEGYLQQDAVNFLNATRHAKDKVKEAGGVIGSEGNKPWLDLVKNAEEGMKAQLTYFEQGYEWSAMQKATTDINKLITNQAILDATPNAVAYAIKYKDHSMSRNQGKLADIANSAASLVGEVSGFGHSNLMTLNNQVKHLIMQKFMGFGNIPFSITQLMQPFQTQPAMIRLMRSRGLEFSTAVAQAKAMNTYVKSWSEGKAALDPFEAAALKYAEEMSIFDVKMADHTKDINASAFKDTWNTVADFNITAPEHLTRGTAFLFYSHMLKDAGMPAKDIFGAAENMTNMSMVNYHQIERPMGYAKLGWLGDAASTLTRYKHNQWSQLAFYGREAGRTANIAPLVTFLGPSIALGGILGMFAYQEADAMYQLFSEHVLKKPDSLNNQILKSELSPLLTHGVASSLGIDMTTRFSNANAVPDSIPQAIFPYGTAVVDMVQAAMDVAKDPTNKWRQKQAVKAVAPQSMQGLVENKMFTDEKGLYVNSRKGPNEGKGIIQRGEKEQGLRSFGFRNVDESRELLRNYSEGQLSKSRKNLYDSLLDKTKSKLMGSGLSQPEKEALMQKAGNRAAELGVDPTTFVNAIVSWEQDRRLPQSKQIELRNANGGFGGAFKQRERNK